MMTQTYLTKNICYVLKYVKIFSSNLGTENWCLFKTVILAVKKFNKFNEIDNKTNV